MTARIREDDDSAVEQDADHSEGERRSGDEGHLDGLEDGCGCAEVWEHLSERRAADSD